MVDPTCQIWNYQLVGVLGTGEEKRITISRTIIDMTPEEALVHAAWLVALADETGKDFDIIRKRVENT